MSTHDVTPPSRVWLLFNEGSRSTDDAALSRIIETIDDLGWTLVGRIRFPDEDLPPQAELEAQSVDTLVALGGDGTIACAAAHYDDWNGRILPLAGGTMNLVPKILHPDIDHETVLRAVAEKPRTRTLPFIACQGHASYARLIAGPVAGFVHVRENVRSADLRRAWRALRFAWRLTWRRSIRIRNAEGRYRAVFAKPMSDTGMEIDAIRSRGWGTSVRMAWAWLRGLFTDLRLPVERTDEELVLLSDHPIRALFDGEERLLDSPAHFSVETTHITFFTTEAP
ncbi:diacylglycerol/lipid kinase family protein [Sphingomicrobium marinum]|uniref:diacylglycerol/lipid kinase family protein n=1 Tax=Sphingomicrobium marinum TaxID=1227950 RepID=UPI00223F0D66|nr:hypothetical protein [Sphingomicrobium marinum]